MQSSQKVDIGNLKKLTNLGVLQEFSTDDFNIKEENFIGEGQKSKVYQSRIKGQEFAIKVVKDSQIQEYLRNLEKQAILNHSNILLFNGFCFSENKLYLIFPFQSKGSLDKQLSEINRIQDNERKNKIKFGILVDIAKGLKYLHKRLIILTNLHPQNILLDNNFNARLSNFSDSIDLKDKKAQSTGELLPPETNSQNYQPTEKVDVYSFGQIAQLLFSESQQISSFFLYQISNLLRLCLSENPENRPTARQIIKKLKEISKQKYGQLNIKSHKDKRKIPKYKKANKF